MNTENDFTALLAPSPVTLRVAFLLPERKPAGWMARVVARARSLRWVDVVAVYALERDEAPSAAWRRYLSRCPDGPGLLRPAEAGPVVAYSPEAVRGGRLDVLIVFPGCRPTAGMEGLARYGVWQFRLDAPEREQWEPPCFRPVWEQEAVTTICLLLWERGGEEARTLYRLEAPTEFSLYVTRNAEAVLQAAGHMLLVWLHRVARGGEAACRNLPRHTVAAERGYPSLAVLGAFVFRQLLRSFRLRASGAAGASQWFVALRREKMPPAVPAGTAGFRPLPNPACGGMADPFLVEHDGQVYLFVEEILPGGRGRLSAARVEPDGSLSGFRPILDRPFHLSYPHVFFVDGEAYLIPESSADRNVVLYRATGFPYEWEADTVLFSGLALVDTTVWREGEQWFLFTTTSGLPETLLFTAPALRGPWTPHPRSPICSDVRSARGAGPLFRDRQGRRIRPAQNSTLRYGRALAFQQVTVLTAEDYAEQTVDRIFPDWTDGLLATHAFTAAGGWQAIDGRR